MPGEIARLLPLALLSTLGVAGCSGLAIIESSATTVTIRYGGIDAIEEATQLAHKTCAAHHKTARLRNIANFGLIERYGHFDCI